MVAIPPHGLNGVLPPFVGADAASAKHSPYRAPLSEFVDRFATSARRVAILQGFFDLRRELKSLGVTTGVQWLDGSFTEQIPREPNDLDVITFFDPPAAWSAPAVAAGVSTRRDVFDATEARKKYLCDAYYVGTDRLTPRLLLYWYGLFGHRRGSLEWKGLIEVALAEDERGAADRLAQKVIP